ncbi:hypothetical protein LTR36_002901 [Oleoguttula mirabilis]|uniref:ABC transporter n=1 Tax=Oleoguttula mirabilis TaxID=1507867 RepID=A0AAV9JKN6_9PEZI|nr:hypothetical protein LTR36_002901 [Oleoguttula mirabilis]
MPSETAPWRKRPFSNGSNTKSVPHSHASTAKSEELQAAPWKSLFFFTTKGNLPVLIFGIVWSVIAGAVSPAQSYVTGKIFNGFTSYATGAVDAEKLMQEQKKYILYLVAVAGASWLFHSLQFMFWLAFGELQAKSARDRLFHGLLEKDIEWYDMRKNGIGALLPRLQTQIRDLQLAASQPLGLLISAVAQLFLSLAEAFYYSWKLTLVTLATSPLIMVAMIMLGNRMQQNIAKQQVKLAEAQKFSTSAFSVIETVKCFNGQDIEQQKYEKRIHEAASCYFRVVNFSGLQMACAVLLSSSMFVQGFYYGGVLISKGELNAGTVVTTFFAAIGGFQAINMILPQMINLEKGRTAGATLRAIMAEMQKGPKVRRRSGLLRPSTCRGDIDVKHLTFAYPSRPDQVALDDVTMNIPGGELTFLIGKSGSGKSTLSQLLMRFYSASQGEITIDGVPLESLDVGWLRSNVTLVEQTSLLFNDTVFRNIAFGRRDHEKVTRQEAMEAAEFALLQLMISDMPEGLDTMVGYKGGSMSGGQRQRMALARARLRDTPILLLDESTSALDHISRALMMDAIRQWRHGKTTIIITHDVTQILPDDYLYLLEHGRVAQDGYRKHLEKMKDTPFQGFLPPEQRATLSPYDARKGTNFESIRTRGSSLDSNAAVNRQTHVSYDALEAQLHAGENKRASFLPSALRDGSPLPAMGPFGRIGAGASPWLRGAVSPPSNSPIELKRQSQLWDTDAKRRANLDDHGDSTRWSRMLEQLVERTGKLAADARQKTLDSGSRRRQPHDAEAGAALAIAAEDPHYGQSGKRSLAPDEKQDKSLKHILGTVWPNIDRSAKGILLFGFYGCTVHAVASPLFSYVLSKLIGTYAIPGGDKHKQLVYSMAILGIAVTDAAHTWLERFLLGCVGQLWVDSVRDHAFQRILDQPKAFFDQDENSISRLTDSLDRNPEAMRDLLGNFAGLVYVGVLMCAVSVGWALSTQWKMSLIALAVGPYILGVTRLFSTVSGKWEARSNDAVESSSAIFTETFTNIKTVRALTLESHFRDKYITATNHALVVGFQRSFNIGFFFGLSDSASSFAQSLVLYVGSKLASQGTSVGDVIQVAVMLTFAITGLGAILEWIPQVGSSQDAALRLMRLSTLQSDSHEHMGDTRVVTIGEIVFDNLRFAYPSRPEQTILKDLNLKIHPGTSTAIVGGSGSGKSTIANLLLDIWSTTQTPATIAAKSGELTIAGRDVQSISTTALRSLIVPVAQTPTLFAASVADNISYGLPADSPYNNTASVHAAAQQAGIHDFIVSLPSGYNTAIGDGGMGLSGGQAQRIAIARALVRKPAVLILDEATSALDVESANLVRQTIRDLIARADRGMTVIIITHNTDMMEMAENIVVLDQGEIVEEGGFDDLMGKNGPLANLLGGGEWDGERERRRAGSSRKRGLPKLRDVDWKAGNMTGRRKRL